MLCFLGFWQAVRKRARLRKRRKGRLGLSNFGIGFGTLEQVDSLSIITQVALGFIAFVIGNEFPVSLD